MKTIIKLINFSLLGGILMLLIAFIFLSLIGLPFYGWASFLLPLYFWGYIIFISPFGMLIGGYTAYAEHSQKAEKEKGRSSLLPSMLTLVFYLCLLLAIIFLPLGL